MIRLQFTPPTLDLPADSVIMDEIGDKIDEITHTPWQDLMSGLAEWALKFGTKLAIAIAVLIVGRWLIKRFDRLVDKIFARRRVDSSVNTLIRNMIRLSAWLVLIIILIAVLGIQTSSFVALVASAGFAVGMALSGTLQNFAGGILILVLKPFRRGDYISAQGQEGTVKEIRLFSTILITADNKTIILPNGGMASSIVNNVSETGTRRVEWTFGIGLDKNYDDAKSLLKALLDSDKRILTTPPYFIAISALTGGVLSIVVRAWTITDDYLDVFYDMNEKVYKMFPAHGFGIPGTTNSMNVILIEPKKTVANQNPSPANESHDELKKKASEIGNEVTSGQNSITCDDLGLRPGGGTCEVPANLKTTHVLATVQTDTGPVHIEHDGAMPQEPTAPQSDNTAGKA